MPTQTHTYTKDDSKTGGNKRLKTSKNIKQILEIFCALFIENETSTQTKKVVLIIVMQCSSQVNCHTMMQLHLSAIRLPTVGLRYKQTSFLGPSWPKGLKTT